MRLLALAILVAACSSDEDRERKQTECDKIAADIRAAAVASGVPPTGACNNPTTPQFGDACAALQRCNAEVDAM